LNTPNLFDERYHKSDRINILYLLPHMVVGGAERIDLDILQGLDREKFRVILVVELRANHVWYDKFAALVDEIFLTPNFLSGEAQEDAFLDYLLIAKNIDIVFNRNTHCGYRAFARWQRDRREIRCVDLNHLHNFGEDWLNQSAPFHETMHRRYVTNEDLKKYTIEKYEPNGDTFRVIFCGVDCAVWDPKKRSRGKLRTEMRASAGRKLVGFVGRFDEQKDPLKWLEVARQIHSRDREILFAMVGGGELLEKAMAQSKEMGLGDYVHFCGYRDDVPDLVIDFDCLLLVSRYEGLPQVVIETLALGIPVISSDAGGTRECVNGVAGKILPLDAPPERFAEVVHSELEADSPELHQARRNWIVANFSVENMQRRYVQEFMEMRTEIDRAARLKESQIGLMGKPLFP
jgi:glycosyltransferase involved in cell wall biosynthesis